MTKVTLHYPLTRPLTDFDLEQIAKVLAQAQAIRAHALFRSQPLDKPIRNLQRA